MHEVLHGTDYTARTGEERLDKANGLPSIPIEPVVREENGVRPEKGEPRTPMVLCGLRPDMGLMLVPLRGI